MERTESKSIQVHPSDEQYYIDLHQIFHWNLQSSQEVNIRDSHLEVRNDKLYSVTESSKYVKLVFVRLYDFENRDKLVNLENEYFQMVYPRKKTISSGTSVFGIILIILGSFMSLMQIIALLILIMPDNHKGNATEFSAKQIINIIMPLLFSLGAIFGGIMLKRRGKVLAARVLEENKIIEEHQKKYYGRRNQILEEAKNY